MNLELIGEAITTISLIGLAVIVYVQQSRLQMLERQSLMTAAAATGMAWSGEAPPARARPGFKHIPLKAAS